MLLLCCTLPVMLSHGSWILKLFRDQNKRRLRERMKGVERRERKEREREKEDNGKASPCAIIG